MGSAFAPVLLGLDFKAAVDQPVNHDVGRFLRVLDRRGEVVAVEQNGEHILWGHFRPCATTLSHRRLADLGQCFGGVQAKLLLPSGSLI